MSKIALKYHQKVLFYTKYTHPTLICRGTDARTHARKIFTQYSGISSCSLGSTDRRISSTLVACRSCTKSGKYSTKPSFPCIKIQPDIYQNSTFPKTFCVYLTHTHTTLQPWHICHRHLSWPMALWRPFRRVTRALHIVGDAAHARFLLFCEGG